MKNISMYIIAHKIFNRPNVKEYIPLQVGAEGKEILEGYKQDNVGDNISIKNPNYCELTGLYWIWKNDAESDVIGISHYRRYFTKQKFFRNINKILNRDQIENIFAKGYDVILPKKEIYKENAIEQYSISSGFKSDFETIREIIKRDHPDYLNAFDKVMKQNRMHQYNMMVCNKKIFDNYCEWLFDILFKLEPTINLEERDSYQKRIYGFISERLINVWIEKNKYRVKELRVFNADEKIKEIVRIKIRRIKNSILFKCLEKKDKVKNDI